MVEPVKNINSYPQKLEIITDISELPDEFAQNLTPDALPPEKNLVFKAVRLFYERTGNAFSGKITIKKRIPQAAGLGGGSSDAAATLLALNSLCGSQFGLTFLQEIAACLGSDVPFFIGNGALNTVGAAIACGRGEQLLFFDAPVLHVVLVNSGLKSNTAEAFSMLDTYRNTKNPSNINKNPVFNNDPQSEFTKNPEKWRFFNSFLPVFLQSPQLSPVYSAILEDLRSNGGLFTSLSGSGSTCFGIFPNKKAAIAAAAHICAKYPFVKYAKKTLCGFAQGRGGIFKLFTNLF